MARHRGRGSRPKALDGKLESALSGTLVGLMLYKNRSLVLLPLLVLAVSVLLLSASTLHAQSPVDDVHIKPRIEPTVPKPSELMDPSLKTHT